jgi:hypothetical protein
MIKLERLVVADGIRGAGPHYRNEDNNSHEGDIFPCTEAINISSTVIKLLSTDFFQEGECAPTGSTGSVWFKI